MKNSIITVLLLFATLTITAQNQNVLKTTEKKVTTIKDSDGEKKIVKTEQTNEVQNVELGEEKPNTINIPIKDSPVLVTKKTEVSVDGDTKSIDIDRSAYYMGNGSKYEIKGDKSGYSMSNSESKKISYLRKISANNYLYVNNGKVSSATFDTDGNLIINTYNEKTDAISTEKFILSK